jgi:hypothetical protein
MFPGGSFLLSGSDTPGKAAETKTGKQKYHRIANKAVFSPVDGFLYC